MDAVASNAKNEETVISSDTKLSRGAADLLFVRARMYYSKPNLNAKGNVMFGLRHIRKLMSRPLYNCI